MGGCVGSRCLGLGRGGERAQRVAPRQRLATLSPHSDDYGGSNGVQAGRLRSIRFCLARPFGAFFVAFVVPRAGSGRIAG